MNRLWKTAACLAGGLALGASLHAASPFATDAMTLKKRVMHAGMQPAVPAVPAVAAPTNNLLSDGPYAPIVIRNVFGLIPPAPPTDTNTQVDAGLPKISPAGIMGVFGDWQVLFKVSPAQPGPGAKDEFYTLSEGQRQDDIEVVKIDSEKSLVTFNNHGTVQLLPLSDAPPSGGTPSGVAPMPRSEPPGYPGIPPGGGPGGLTRFGSGWSGNNGTPANGTPDSNGGGGGMDFNAPSSQSRIYQPPASTMSPDDAQALLIINHLKAQAAGSPIAPLYPPTPHDQEAGILPGPGSSPSSGDPPAP